MIPCLRCKKPIDRPDETNAYYIMADDTRETEERETLYALQETRETSAKRKRGILVEDSELFPIQVSSYEASRNLFDVIRVVMKMEKQDVQKTGLICPDCLQGADLIIWGRENGSDFI